MSDVTVDAGSEHISSDAESQTILEKEIDKQIESPSSPTNDKEEKEALVKSQDNEIATSTTNTTSEPQPSMTPTIPKQTNQCAKNNSANSEFTKSGTSSIYNVEIQLQKAKRDLESMVLKYAKSERENITNKNKIDELDRKLKRAIKDNDSLANRLKILNNEKEQLGATLSAKVAKLTVLEQKNSSNAQAEKLKELELKISDLEHQNQELLNQIESYKSKEGELLDFSERLSMKHMMLQSELENIQRQVPDYKSQYDAAIIDKKKLLEENESLSEQLSSVKISLGTECKTVETLKEEKESIETSYRRQLDQVLNEMTLMKRKHQLMSKEYLKKIKLLQSELDRYKPSITNGTEPTEET